MASKLMIVFQTHATHSNKMTKERMASNQKSLPLLLREIRACQHCEADLEFGARPILKLSNDSRILIIGQAPGKRVHETGIAWDDPSGDRLRKWLGVTSEQFYDEQLFALIPMGFCYPGKGKSGDRPPRPECAELWHEKVMAQLPQVKLTLLVGQYAQNYVLRDRRKSNLTETVRAWKEFRPKYLPLPHPSPRNIRWFKNNLWFDESVIPYLKKRVKTLCL